MFREMQVIKLHWNCHLSPIRQPPTNLTAPPAVEGVSRSHTAGTAHTGCTCCRGDVGSTARHRLVFPCRLGIPPLTITPQICWTTRKHVRTRLSQSKTTSNSKRPETPQTSADRERAATRGRTPTCTRGRGQALRRDTEEELRRSIKWERAEQGHGRLRFA